MKLFEELDPMHPQDNNYIEMLLEMDQHDVKERRVKDMNDIKHASENVTKAIQLDPKTDPMRFNRHQIKRHELFKHEIFGNNYRMFGIEKPFDIDEIPWR